MVNYKKFEDKAKEAQRLVDEEGYTVAQAAVQVGLSRSSLYKNYGVRKKGRVSV